MKRIVMSDKKSNRHCGKCNRDLPATEEHWYPSALRSVKTRWCRLCNQKYGQTPKAKAAQQRCKTSPQGRAKKQAAANTPRRRAKLRQYHKKYAASALGRARILAQRNDPEARKRKRNRDFLVKYGITYNDYMVRHTAQGGVCKLCQRPETWTFRGKVVSLAVDHDHSTGTVRDLLCHRCNVTLGLADDDPTRLRAMADYIEKHRHQQKRSA